MEADEFFDLCKAEPRTFCVVNCVNRLTGFDRHLACSLIQIERTLAVDLKGQTFQ